MNILRRPWGAMHYRIDGPENGMPVVFANSLGTDLRLWDALLSRLPGICAIRFDKRGHGLSDLGGWPSISDLADDAAALLDYLKPGRVVFVGISVGGMIGQALAASRPDLLKALVLSNSAVKMGSPQLWQARIEVIRQGGTAAITDAVMERWFGPVFRASPQLSVWRNMLSRSDDHGYIAICKAIAAADLTDTAAKLRLPVQVIAGSADGSSPPDLVQATANLIEGASYHLIPDVGHLPPVEAPQAFADCLVSFLKDYA
ncbi:3-oxoadipate enol-lactonase [Paracoccus caeni]|uniref:3-oxoadipate enol-lactonase n=1 Tax=Paracoccus caeni TaxID=657651 RepID=A0A934VYV3_9RHOB|nr:3-oxoadipate enol-lactonase [Paracoccus caeni]MBK4214623.1 3-oxoadipate enol-lactonase [Paracoccus caeni]